MVLLRAKQIIVVRGDLNFRSKGKLAAQCCHASLGAIFSKSFVHQSEILNNSAFTPPDLTTCLSVQYGSELQHWFEDKFTKIVVKCNDEAELFDLAKQCEDNGVRHALIKDAGDTVFKEPTYTCLGIGPEMENKIDLITKHLKLM